MNAVQAERPEATYYAAKTQKNIEELLTEGPLSCALGEARILWKKQFESKSGASGI